MSLYICVDSVWICPNTRSDCSGGVCEMSTALSVAVGVEAVTWFAAGVGCDSSLGNKLNTMRVLC